jgi:glyoxylase I family protein
MTAGWLHHIDLTVSEMAQSLAFYDRVLPLMGFRRIADCDEGPLWAGQSMEIGLQPARPGSSKLRHDRYAPGLHHVAFGAPSTAEVDGLKLEYVYTSAWPA